MSKKKESKKLVHMHDEYELFCKMVTSPAEFDMYVWNSLVFDMSLRWRGVGGGFTAAQSMGG